MEAKMQLRDSKTFPSNEILKELLGEGISNILDSFLEVITNDEYRINSGMEIL